MNAPVLTDHAMPAPAQPAPSRTGACPFCLRKHLLKARGYAREVVEDATREWERDGLLENLLLAEDHAVALGNSALATDIRATRLVAESGSPSADETYRLYDRFLEQYAATFARDRKPTEF